MEQYNIQQNPSPKLPHSPLILDSADFSLSQTYNPSTKSTNPQRLDSIDPECFSPLTLGSTNPSSFLKPRDCGHKHHKGSNMGQLRVKVFHYLQEKNESMYSLVSEEETPSYSVSTSANTPGYLESAQLRNGSEGSMSRGSSRNEISRQNSEETQNRENADISSSVNSQSQTTVSANGSSTQATIDNTLSTNNTDNNSGQTNNAANPSDSGFMDSLEFILEKTPIISIFMSMICLALTAGIAVSVIDGKDTYTFLFIILYVFLIYLIIEKTFKLFRACGTNSPTLASLVRLEAFYSMLDVIALLVIAVVVNLRLAEVIESYNVGLYPLIGNFVLYSVYSRPPLKQKISGIVKRGLFVAQFFMFMRKAEGELPISWHFVSCFGWILLSKLAIKLIQGIIKVSKAFTGLNILSSISKAAKVTGMIGLFLLGADLGVLMMILAGACSLLDSPDRDIEDLKLWLTICQYLNACLLFFTTIAGADLLEFIMGAAEHFNPFDEVKVKPKQLEFSKQETYVYRMSSTYYKVVEKSEEDSVDENMDKEGCEDNTCYICCGNEANGIVLDCGHGGICYDCLKDYITRKEECMECRKKINSVLKIESEVRKDKLFKGEEICSIVRK